MKELLIKILEKKELKNLDPKVAERFLKEFLTKNPKLNKEELKKREKEEIVKGVRRKLREVFGVFKEKGDKEKLVEELESLDDLAGHDKILSLHKSTKERLDDYSYVYTEIFAITGKPKKILDLGCGLNPFSLPYMEVDLEYNAIDVDEGEIKLIQKYFDKFKIKGKAWTADLLIERKFPKADICFMLKLLDTLETQKKDISKELIECLDAKWIAASFSTKSLGGKKVLSPKRLVWFERIISNYNYMTFAIGNEVFYVIEK